MNNMTEEFDVWKTFTLIRIFVWFNSKYIFLFQVVRYILNRNACLLPSYFAVNEVTKLFAEDRSNPHWVCISNKKIIFGHLARWLVANFSICYFLCFEFRWLYRISIVISNLSSLLGCFIITNLLLVTMWFSVVLHWKVLYYRNSAKCCQILCNRFGRPHKWSLSVVCCHTSLYHKIHRDLWLTESMIDSLTL